MIQSLRRKKKGWQWPGTIALALFLVGMSGLLTGCDILGLTPTFTSAPTPLATPVCTDEPTVSPTSPSTAMPAPTSEPTSISPTEAPTPQYLEKFTEPEPGLPDSDYVQRRTDAYPIDAYKLARMIWNEERKWGDYAMRWAAWVAINRVTKRYHGLSSLEAVLTEPNAFNYPSLAPVETVKASWPGDGDKVAWFDALRTADKAVTGFDQDPIHGWEHFINFNEDFKRAQGIPDWSMSDWDNHLAEYKNRNPGFGYERVIGDMYVFNDWGVVDV
jgi:hypothetical protein